MQNTEPLADQINQSGITTGPDKLALIQKALKLRETPAIGSQDGKGDEAIAYVKLFDPAGNWTWYLTEWDGGTVCFGLVDGFEAELGDIDLEEISETPGPMGIGIEVDVWWLPKTLKEIRAEIEKR